MIGLRHGSAVWRILLLVLLWYAAFAVHSAPSNRMDSELIRIYKIAGVNPFDFVAANNLAVKYATEGRYSIAEKLLLRADRLAPGRSDIVDNLQMVRRLISQVKNLPPRALEQFSKTFEKQHIPSVPNTWSVTESTTKYNDQGVYELNQNGDASGNPFMPDTLIQLADLKLRKGEYRAAMKYLLRAKNLDPFRSEVDAMILRIKALAPENFMQTPAYRATIREKRGEIEVAVTNRKTLLPKFSAVIEKADVATSSKPVESDSESSSPIELSHESELTSLNSTEEIPDQWVLE